MAKKNSWSCKNERHDTCNGLILMSSIMKGVEGLINCACVCHKEVKDVST